MNPKDVSVLVIDDESMIVDQLKYFFTELNYAVVTTTDSVEALELLQERSYDIVLTDLKMPRVSGMEIVKIIKDLGYDSKVMIFTGFATADSAIDAIKFGVHRYIQKPYNLNELRDTVQTAAEQLYLERENIALNRKIQTMFEYLSTLYDIVSIVYQVTDFDMSMEMVLDTLTEGINAEKAFISLLDAKQGCYSVLRTTGLSDEFAQSFRFKIGDVIRSQTVDGTEPQVFSGKSAESDPLGSQFETLVLVPIQYREEVLGFIGTGDLSEEVFTMQDYLRLLSTLALQVGPILHSQSEEEQGSATVRTVDNLMEKIVTEQINQAKQAQSLLSFALLRLVTHRKAADLPPMEKIKETFSQKTRQIFAEGAKIVWQNFDQALVIIPGKNAVDAELYCSQLRTVIEGQFQGSNEQNLISLHYATAVYPGDGRDSATITGELNHRLFQAYDCIESQN